MRLITLNLLSATAWFASESMMGGVWEIILSLGRDSLLCSAPDQEIYFSDMACKETYATLKIEIVAPL